MTLTLSQPDSRPSGADTGVIRLSGHATTVTADELRTQLATLSDLGEPIAIDASELLSVGQAVLQLLIAARRDATSRDQDFHFIGASDAFSERVASCQLAEAIGLDIGKGISQ